MYLIAEDIIVHIVLLGTLRGEDEGLCEPPHGLSTIAELPGHLDNDTVTEGRLRVHLADLGMTVLEVELLDAVVDLLLPDDRFDLPVGSVQTTVDERRSIVIKPEE